MPQNILNGMVTQQAGSKTKLNITAATVVKASPGVVTRLSIISPGTAGQFTINDCATLGAASTANQVYSEANTAQQAGAFVEVQWPFLVGITISAVPPGSNTCVAYT
jgi:hypothetical protein